MEGYHVKVALYQDALAAAGYLRLGEPYAQKLAAFYVNLCFRGVYVLCGVVCVKGSAAEGKHPAAHGMDGEHHPLAEFVCKGAVFPLHGKAGGEEVFGLVAGGACGVQQSRAAGGGPAKAEALYGLILKAAGAQICITYSLALWRFQLGGEELLGEFAHQQEAFPALAALYFLGSFLLLNYVYAILAGKIAESLYVRAVLVLHYEADGRSGLAAAEAFEYTL